MPLAEVALRDVLRERIGVPVVVDNDATCAALAEAYDDDGALVARHLVMFTIGTGVGVGIVIDGRAYRGATGAAAELGHTIVGADLSRTPFTHADGFPQRGSVESLASRTALNVLGRVYGIPAGTVVDAARDGHPGAAGALELLGRRLASRSPTRSTPSTPISSSSAAASASPANCCSVPRARRQRATC